MLLTSKILGHLREALIERGAHVPASWLHKCVNKLVAQVANGAEKALADAQLVDLPNTGAFALPLAAHGFLVGLLVLEQIVWPKPALCTNMMQTGHMAASRRGKFLQHAFRVFDSCSTAHADCHTFACLWTYMAWQCVPNSGAT